MDSLFVYDFVYSLLDIGQVKFSGIMIHFIYKYKSFGGAVMNTILKVLFVCAIVLSFAMFAFAAGGSKEEGKKIFQKNCIQCHGLNGNADTRLGHLLSTPPANFSDPTYRDSRGKKLSAYTDEELQSKIKYGSKGTAMPSWKSKLSDDEIASVLYYVRSFENSAAASK